MDILGILGGLAWLPVVVVVIVLIAVIFVYIRIHTKIADANQALVITGGKGEPKILVGGGAFVSPFRKADLFDLGLITVTSTNDETQSSTMIPVIVEWTAQLRADTSLDDDGRLNESLRNAILGYTKYSGKIDESLQQTLEGEVRAVIATMTPEELVRKKSDFASKVETDISDSMKGLGFKLVSLNIGKITDENGYYEAIAAKDRQLARREAANLSADADQAIAVRSAEADQASKLAQQIRDLALAEQQRDLALRRAQIKSETSIAEADAEIAGQLQLELRNQDLATRQGEVAVVKEQQNQTAAAARREVKVIEADTAKQTQVIEAQAAAQQSVIDAEAAANVAKQKAQGEADAKVATAKGDADAKNVEAEAEANRIRQTGVANADSARALGEATAAATLAAGTADAEVLRLKAEALAANDGANLKVTIAEIESTTRISIATQTATVMAEVGRNAKFVDMGGNTGGKGNLLSGVLGDFPELLNLLDVKSDALSGSSFGVALGEALHAIKTGEASHGDPVVAASTLVERPAPTTIAGSPSSESATSVVEPVHSAAESDLMLPDAAVLEPTPLQQTATVEHVGNADEVNPVTRQVIEHLIDSGQFKEILDQAQADGTSITDVAATYGVSSESLEKILSEKFTAGELVDMGLKFGKSRSSRKRS